MSEDQLTDLIQRAGDRTLVGAPRLEAISAGGRRRRRFRLITIGTAVAALVAVSAGVALSLSTGPEITPNPAIATPAPSTTEAPLPDGTRLVGLGSVAIAVPETWATNALRCGVPQRDTVVIDQGAIETCATARPAKVDSIEIVEGPVRFDFKPQDDVQVQGVTAQRSATACAKGYGSSQLCSVTLNFTSLGVWVRAESSTSIAAERLLDGVRLSDDRVGVPGYQALSGNYQGRGGQRYVDKLHAAGLTAQVETVSEPGLPAGFIRDVSPQPGTVLARGSTVTVTVVAAPRGHEEELRVDVNTDREGVEAADPSIRRGATLELQTGDRIWAYASGRRQSTLAGSLTGRALIVDDWRQGPNYPHSWIADGPGTTVITLTITADGTPVEVGTVTVRVTA